MGLAEPVTRQSYVARDGDLRDFLLICCALFNPLFALMGARNIFKKNLILKKYKVMKSSIELYVSQKVREYRTKNGWSYQYLADCLNLSMSFVAHRENPNTDDAFNLDHVSALAKIFDIKIWDLLPEYPLD